MLATSLFTLLLHLWSLILGLMPFGWLCCIMHYSDGNIIFYLHPVCFMPTFSLMQLGHKTMMGHNSLAKLSNMMCK
jgi:hypothetical protein